MVADPRYLQHADLAHRAAALTRQVEALLRRHPACAAELEAKRKGERYIAPRIPSAMAILKGLDPAAWRKADALWREADGYRWQLVQAAEPALMRRLRHLNHVQMTKEDWKQEALLGAYNGALRWDPSRGGGWVRFACDWAYARAQRTLTWRAQTLRVSQHTWDLKRDLRGLHIHLGYRPSDEEAAEILGRDVAMIRLARTRLELVSTESSDYGEDGTTFGERLTDEGPTPDELLVEGHAGQHAVAAVMAACHTERERTLMRLRFGLDDGEALTLAEIATDLGGMSRERVRQIEAQVLGRARGLLESRTLADLEALAAAEPAKLAPERRPDYIIGRPTSLTLAQEAEALRLYAEGVKQSEIARRIEAPRSTVQRLCALSGITVQQPERGTCPVHPQHRSSHNVPLCDYCKSSVRLAALAFLRSGRPPGAATLTAAAIRTLSDSDCDAWTHADAVRGMRDALRDFGPVHDTEEGGGG